MGSITEACLMPIKVRSQNNLWRVSLTFCAAILVVACWLNNASAKEAAQSALSAGSSENTASVGAQSDDAFDSKKLTAAEKLYFGSSYEQLPAEKRMDKLERGVFGRNRSGSLNKRFERIARALGPNCIAESSSLRVAPAIDEHAVTKEVSSASSDVAASSKSEPQVKEKLVDKSDASDSKKNQVTEQSETDAPVQALLRAGMAAHQNGQTQAAEEHFKAALAIDPRCADAFYNLGSIAESKGDLLSALTNYRAALGINPLDRELQNAVKSVEDDVAKSRATASGVNKNQSLNAVGSNLKSNNAMPKTAPPYYRANNYQGTCYAAYSPNTGYSQGSADGKLFNLQTAQSNALMQTQGSYTPVANVSQPAIPVYNVGQQSAPTLNVSQSKPPGHSNSGVNSLVNVLMMSTPLHCPICRLKQMGNW